MYSEALQEERKETIVFRIKREHSGVEHDTIGFKDQPRKIRKLAEVFLLRSIPANREPELFLKRVEKSEQNNSSGFGLCNKLEETVDSRRREIRKGLIDSFRRINGNAIKCGAQESLKIVDLDKEMGRINSSKGQQPGNPMQTVIQMENQNESEDQQDVYYTLQVRQKTRVSEQKHISFPYESVSFALDSDEQQCESESVGSEKDSDYEQRECTREVDQRWKQLQNGREVEYIDHYSSFHARFGNKKNMMG